MKVNWNFQRGRMAQKKKNQSSWEKCRMIFSETIQFQMAVLSFLLLILVVKNDII